MATINESSIMSMAKDVVSDFIDGKATLNEGIVKKAQTEGLNKEQTKRLIERTNVDAFLRQYPNTTDFDIADPEVILGTKTSKIASCKDKATLPEYADEGMFKAASVNKVSWKLPKLTHGESRQYTEKISSITSEDLFGINTDEFIEKKRSFNYDYALDKESQAMFKSLNDLHKTAAEINRENTAREIEFNDAIEDFAFFIKQAALSGCQSIAESEYELLNKFPENQYLVRTLYDSIIDNMKTACVAPKDLVRASTPKEINKFASDTELSIKFKRILDIAGN